MSESEKVYTLHYGGEKIEVETDILVDWDGEARALHFRRSDGDYMTILLGSGIPAAVVRTKRVTPQVRVATTRR